MNILLCPGNWYKSQLHGGGEVYLSRLIESLKAYGHSFKGICQTTESFTHNNIDFVPQGGMQNIWINNNELFQWSDIVFTQLQGNPYAYNKCIQHNKQMIFFAHNTAKSYFTNKSTKVVYNSKAMADLNLFDCQYFIQQPIIPKGNISNGKKIALVNCNRLKGVELFNELAECMPYQFLGIKGAYGEQILSNAIEYKEHSEKIGWSDIKLLLVPSEIESWSQVASEAISHGIPVIASPLPGIKENLSYAGIYIDRNNISLYKETISWLMDNEHIYLAQMELCLRRANEYNNSLDNFNEWLINK